MPLMPNAEAAFVDDAKLAGYLLNISHEQGGPKAAVYLRFGFDPVAPERLRLALLALAHTADARPVPALGGMKYVVEGPVDTPDGRRLWLRTVWKDDHDQGRPRLVTAYPGDEAP